jgi:hypothetical protein
MIRNLLEIRGDGSHYKWGDGAKGTEGVVGKAMETILSDEGNCRRNKHTYWASVTVAST